MPFSRFAPPCFALACLVPGAVLAQTNGWRPAKNLQIEGVAVLPGNLHYPFRALRSGGLFALRTTRGTNGALDGMVRREAANAQGIFTWLDAAPEWALQIPEPSLPEIARICQPIHAAPQEVQAGSLTLSRRFGQDIRIAGQGTLCGRPCQLLTVTNSAAPGVRTTQHLWVDTETGLLLRRDEDSVGNSLFSYTLSAFVPNPTVAPSAFALPVGTKTICGLVNAGILLHTKDTPDAAKEMQKLRVRSRFAQGSWILALPAPAGFTFAQTLLQEDGAPLPDANQNMATADLSRWGLILDGEAVSGTRANVFSNDIRVSPGDAPNTVILRNNPANDMSEMVERRVTLARQINVEVLTRRQSVEEAMAHAETAARAAELAAPGSPERAAAEAEADAARNAAAQAQWQNVDTRQSLAIDYSYTTNYQNNSLTFPFSTSGTGLPAGVKARVETNFLDRATGDTVSFFQLHERDWQALLHGIKTASGTGLKSGRFGAIGTFEATVPFVLHGIVCQEGSSTFVLTSTRLDAKALLALAEALSAPATYYEFSLSNDIRF